jgi:hypothetical protein
MGLLVRRSTSILALETAASRGQQQKLWRLMDEL